MQCNSLVVLSEVDGMCQSIKSIHGLMLTVVVLCSLACLCDSFHSPVRF